MDTVQQWLLEPWFYSLPRWAVILTVFGVIVLGKLVFRKKKKKED